MLTCLLHKLKREVGGGTLAQCGASKIIFGVMPSVMCQLLLPSCKQIYFCFDIMFESISWNCHWSHIYLLNTSVKSKRIRSWHLYESICKWKVFMSWTQIIVTQNLSLWDGICTIKVSGIVTDNTGISFYFLNYGHERFLCISTSMPAKFSDGYLQTDHAILRACEYVIAISQGLHLVSKFTTFLPGVATRWCETIRHG